MQPSNELPSKVKLGPDGPVASTLVAWYGAYQVVHILLNLVYGRGTIPAVSTEVWHQIAQFLDGLAIIHAANGVLAVIFVIAFFMRKKSRIWLGTMTLTISMYEAIAILFMSIGRSGDIKTHLLFYLPFAPVAFLFVLTAKWALADTTL